MISIKSIFYYLASFTLIFAISEVYLKAKKIWKHKSENKVAESISIPGELVSIGTMLIWAINHCFFEYWIGVVDEVLLMILGTLRVLVGIKLWVVTKKSKNFYQEKFQEYCLKAEVSENKNVQFNSNSDLYYVIVIPQNKEQEKEIIHSLPELSQSLMLNTKIYHSNPFFSKEDANYTSKSYRQLDFYSIVTSSL